MSATDRQPESLSDAELEARHAETGRILAARFTNARLARRIKATDRARRACQRRHAQTLERDALLGLYRAFGRAAALYQELGKRAEITLDAGRGRPEEILYLC